MPCVDVLVELIHRFLLNFKSADVFVLDLLDTFEDILHAGFMTRQRSAVGPVAPNPVNDEVVLYLSSVLDFWFMCKARRDGP